MGYVQANLRFDWKIIPKSLPLCSMAKEALFSNLTRSELMSRIRSKGNKSTELRLIQIFKALGIRGWRRNKDLIGRPDFIFPAAKFAVFVDGCYWHGCPQHFKQPKSNAAFWTAKITNNKSRDRRVDKALRSKGWTVIRIWEHSLKKPNRSRLLRQLEALAKIGSTR